MTNPSDPWSRRPDPDPVDGPTEKVGRAGGPAGHTAEAGAAYGPTENYAAPTDYFAQPPGPDATRVMPPPDAAWGAYESGGGYAPTSSYETQYLQPGAYAPPGAGGYPGYPVAPGVPGGQQPGGYPPPGGPQPPKRNKNLWVVLGIAAFVLVALAGVSVGVLLANKDSSSDTASSTRTTTGNAFPLPLDTGTSGVPLPSGIPQIPGFGDIEGLGADMGTIASNDGKTLTMTTLAGDTVTVKTDASTQVISLSSTTVADLKVGEMVMVEGDKAADGTIQAKIIISTSLPSAPR
ncbi:DUF5666 domain-containing protein [Nocardia sp. NPDC127526]|uniref:DUF5666 domain-containing protein n=1 Tax=Nocardia sp. NPDC127526 TaxID=3345393 RepID=UPI003637EA61